MWPPCVYSGPAVAWSTHSLPEAVAAALAAFLVLLSRPGSHHVSESSLYSSAANNFLEITLIHSISTFIARFILIILPFASFVPRKLCRHQNSCFMGPKSTGESYLLPIWNSQRVLVRSNCSQQFASLDCVHSSWLTGAHNANNDSPTAVERVL